MSPRLARRAALGDHCIKSLPKREDHVLRPFAVLALVVVTSSGSPAAAQDSWPSKPITVIVPFGAGGNTDSLARIYSARLSARLGQQFVIENRVGAGSIIGITSLAMRSLVVALLTLGVVAFLLWVVDHAGPVIAAIWVVTRVGHARLARAFRPS